MKPSAFLGVVACALVLCLGIAVLRAEQGGKAGEISASDDQSRVQTGFDFAKQQGIALDLKRKNRALVGLGSYLVNSVGGCNDCHTAPSYTTDPYAFLGAPKQINVGCYLAGGAPFGPPGPGTPVSRDITPWEDNKPAGLTVTEFIHLMRTGEDPDNPGHVLQVMPWPVYQTMTSHDLEAIYEYLSSIPAIPANTCGVPSE
jgi:hypothetical protein